MVKIHFLCHIARSKYGSKSKGKNYMVEISGALLLL